MRQGNGADLLGVNNPRSATLGIIYVAPHDSRAAILAALFMQEKLGRTHVVIVLSDQNKAFQGSADFASIKNTRRKIRIHITFVISDSFPALADSARQQRFPVYSSLEGYTQALQDEDLTTHVTKRRSRQSIVVSPPDRNPLETHEEPSPTPIPEEPSATSVSDDLTDDRLAPLDEQMAALIAASESTEHSNSTLETDKGDDDMALVVPSSQESTLSVADVSSLGEDNAVPEDVSAQNQEEIADTPVVATAMRRRIKRIRPLSHDERHWFIVLGLLLCALLVIGGIARAFMLGTSPSSRVTITPLTKDLSNTYLLQAVTNSPDSSQRQVLARILSSNAATGSKTVKATGAGDTPSMPAIGTLTFYNRGLEPYTVPSNTVLTAPVSKVQVATDRSAYIPARPFGLPGTATVPAHTVNSGASSIKALDFNLTLYNSDIAISNAAAFSGGQDPQHYTFVQQSDIDNVVNPPGSNDPPLAHAMKSASQALQAQIHPNEQFVDTNHSQSVCKPHVTSDHQAGDKATNVTVSVTASCSAIVYDQRTTQSLVTSAYKSGIKSSIGTNYSLLGNVRTTLTPSKIAATNDSIPLLVQAEGVWVYQLSDAQKKALAKLIAGQSKKKAQSILLRQDGVRNANIQSSDDPLPTDPTQIAFAVQSTQ